MLDKHYSVLLNETVSALKIKPDGIYLDLTLGMGGHSAKILSQLTTGHLYAFDKDAFAIEKSRSRLSQISNNFTLIHSDFQNITEELRKLKIDKVDGIVADLGISSPQIDNPTRGFSYNKDAPLDMRMDQSQELNAHYIINNYDVAQLVRILRDNAEVKLASQVANAIVYSRPIETTLELANVIRSGLPAKVVKVKNPCKAVFQAIRIEVNNELDSLRSMLQQSLKLLNCGGSIAIISFHSLEDRIVKHFFGDLIKNKLPTKMPVVETKEYSVKVYTPSKDEIEQNNRSRSAKLRVLTKLK
ncbi:S-adenosyl-methyltransferase [Mycoplasmopsis californica HAZ160_1]|uniref:Ribosomal RNA small subunit methyltransferase H n=1 Tax=Mycoplasmopsis californica HAZ160_1 TaxID=1397850 RepID=A0AAT9F7Z5_9BACT|nr:16S rRNA (cytosine(1402)-N(4))-methyltransferase RsmH [Mycoplasmopsis californica]BAP01027.1 S-adenosyl-methyltransferase [Mycoplasmopsis californica HAZ160_1]BBG40892.1 S-adenosyl-methyltransferase [Mycoplasmopsis californica]BBG41486.1 S-adenosyl-methyltransferase [Mycoplasmopsis californica]BBG42079.1 S-adenosyl-methyltransferase [Mycoplasmopsis californica]BBG42662.1 S-adenosyl-methyltransferase [Mycoplasmopsis californica]